MCHRHAHHRFHSRDERRATRPNGSRRGFCSHLLLWGLGLGTLLLATHGCVGDGPRQWIEDTEDHNLPTVGTRRVSLKTSNGHIQVRPANQGAETIEIHAIVRAGGRDQADAARCRDAIEIAMPVSGRDDSIQDITWAWREPKQPSWSADVSFEIAMPVELDVTAETDNGRIDVVGVLGDCVVKSDNGAIRVVAAQEQLSAETTNGEIIVESPAEDLNIRSTNGAVRATLTNSHNVGGTISTTNGSVTVKLAKTAATSLDCRTVHGSVKNSLPLTEREKKTSRTAGKNRSHLKGQLAGGGATLDVQTTNGNIELQPYAPRDAHD
jgi:Putative adhesin